MPKCILFVDDEKSVLNSLKRAFFDTEFETVFAGGGIQALDIIGRQKVDMIITDMRMPDMDGYKLLKTVMEEKPSIIRIILSGYSEKETIIKAISSGTAKSYISKPWDNEKLKNEITGIFAIYDKIHDKGLLNIINNIKKMPVLPQAYTDILALVEQNPDMDKIADFVSQNPGYSAKILNIVNSSFYGVHIGSIKQSVVYLGLDTVKNIMLSSELFEIFTASGTHMNLVESVWEHSKQTNKIYHRLYFLAHKKKIPDEYSSAGLLHALGRLMMLKYFPSEFARIVKHLKENPQKSLCDAEVEILGVSHSHLGAWVFDWWNLPFYLVEACLYHSNPLEPNIINKEFIALCHIAHIISWKLQNNDTSDFEINPLILKNARVTKSYLNVCLEEISHDV